MKMKFNKKYISIGIIAFVVIVCAIIFFFMCFELDSFKAFLSNIIVALNPVIYGIVIGYLFNPITKFLERKIFYPLALRNRDDISPRKKRVFRVISIILTYIIVVGLLTLFICSVIPQLITSIQMISKQFPIYRDSVTKWWNSLMLQNSDLIKSIGQIINVDEKETYSYLSETLLPKAQNLLISFSSGVFSAIKSIWHFIIGLIISFYVLLNKEQFAAQAKKITYSMFSTKRANLIIKDTRFVSDTFVGFISGKIVDSLIIGVLCFIGCSILKFPYPVLISVIVGVTNIIPFFGPFIGAIPSAFLILMIDPLKCLYFIVFVLILQQFDGNILGPKILGDSTGLSGFWVIFSITVFGALWGVGGMIVGIPFFAVVYALIKRNVERRLISKELPVGTDDYKSIKRIEEDGQFVELMEANVLNYKYIPKPKEAKKPFGQKLKDMLKGFRNKNSNRNDR